MTRIPYARRIAWALVIWAAWTLYAVFAASQNFVSRAYSGRISFLPALRYALLDSWLWAAVTPLVFVTAGALVRRNVRRRWMLPALFITGIAFAVIHLVAFVQMLPFIGYRNTPQVVESVIMGKFHSDVLTCWALFGIRFGIEYYTRYRVRELKASQLEARLAVARLEMLKMQLHPHFLFNTLHAVSALMYRDVEAAERMVARLSDFLRLTLDSAGVQEVTLKSEMEYLDKYLEIEQVRFGERLEVRRAIEAETLDLMVPNLALQPLAENAVRHGIAPRAGGGRLEIAARVEPSGLVVEVTDDGPGAACDIREGVGLANTRARLAQLYGDTARLELSQPPGGGFRARLVLPARTEPADARADRR
ncbi:MAG TPA: histidine kinase [Bryobacteraceae bacterium]